MFVICFISQWLKRTKHGLFVFPPKKTLIWRRHCSIDQSCWSMTSKRFLESSSGMKFFQPSNQPKARCVCIRSINQSNRSISVLLLFLFCLRVFILRSYENRSNNFARALRFFYISLPSLHDHNVKVPHFTFSGGRKHKTRNFFCFFGTSTPQSFRI